MFRRDKIDLSNGPGSGSTNGNGVSQSPSPQRSLSLETIDQGINLLDNTVTDQIWNNPAVQNAIQILVAFSDVGTALPFVAPAFILLKIIIEVERNARDVDAKCNDLLERVTFMLGHLSVLRHVQLTEATRQVIDRMNNALKVAASLIQAYRKQGPVSRRLNVNNKDRFASCAESINTCCNDLMISLQIQQSGQLDILTRSVPIDPEDEAAQIFVARHGGVDVIKDDQQLVIQFAHQLHLNMDERVMEQINTNLADLMDQNQVQLARMLNENVGAAVLDGIKGLAAQINEAEKEQTFTCVQCDKEYRNSTNGPVSCSFHRAEYSSWNKSYPCCSTSHPCQFRSHRARHHCDFPYGSFFQRSRNILNYVDTVDDWATVKDTNLESDASPQATIGRLLRWVSRGERIDEPTILITVGTVWHSEPYFFDTFTIKDFETIANVVHMTRNPIIFRTSPSESEFAMAEWALSSEGVITGVRLTAKAASSDDPYIRVCPIDIAACTQAGDTLTLSEGGLRSCNPEVPYVLPETVRIGPELNDKPLRRVRTDFKTHCSSAFPVILKTTSEPPLLANHLANTDSDNFDGTISVFNKHPAGSPNPITVASITASFRLVGDKNYLPVKSIKILDSQLPITIAPRQSQSLKFQASVPRSDEDARLGVRWWNRAFIARKRPLRLKLTLGEIEGEEASIVLEHIFTPFPLEKPNESDLAFFSFDDPELWTRNCIRITKATGDNGVICIDGTEIDALRLHKVVYRSLKTGETEVNLKVGRDKGDGAWDWGAWALVDLSCRRVYAFKILLKQGGRVTNKTFGSIGYVFCPSYGDAINETRPIRYALETIKLPDLDPYVEQDVVADDSVDDIDPEPLKSSTQISSQTIVPDDLNHRLASIDSSLSRIATAVEQLVCILTKTHTGSEPRSS